MFKFDPWSGRLTPTGGGGSLVPHTHTIAEITGLQDELDDLQDQIDAGGPGSGYSLNDGPDYQASYVYVGLLHTDGSWYIYRRELSTNIRLYASGASSYAAAWTGRTGLTYS